MSYEQKYLKYKMKYKALQNQYSNINKLETMTDNTNLLQTTNNYDLTDTPGTLPSMKGGAINDYVLSDTPINDTIKMIGGTAPFLPLSGVQSCPGIVNPQPNVNVPMTGGTAPFLPLSGVQSCPGIVNPQPNVNVPMTGGVDAITVVETTTELSNKSVNNNSDIRNTADINKLFKQLGGKKDCNCSPPMASKKSSQKSSKKSSKMSSPKSSSSSSNSSSSSSDDISSSSSVSEDVGFEDM